ncbi:hypothetical protein [Comamonas testosteroni]|nr:hypothetical protein [Comamonas testosteroni]
MHSTLTVEEKTMNPSTIANSLALSGSRPDTMQSSRYTTNTLLQQLFK